MSKVDNAMLHRNINVIAHNVVILVILWNSIALTSIVVTELGNTMNSGRGVLYNFVFTKFSFKTVSGDGTAFHRI